MRTLLLGVVLIIILGVGSVLYQNVMANVHKPVACPLDARVCPDGTALARTGLSCTFPECPPPNVTLDSAQISFAVPVAFAPSEPTDDSIAAYTSTIDEGSTTPSRILIHRYAITASSTPLATIQATAIVSPSGLPADPKQYSAVTIAGRTFTRVVIERFEGVIDTAYYLTRPSLGDVLRFDAVDYSPDWMDQHLDTATLPAVSALKNMLAGLQSS